MDVSEWLKVLGLGQYTSAFAENDIDFDILNKLTDSDLKELGVSSLGHRKRLLEAIADREDPGRRVTASELKPSNTVGGVSSPEPFVRNAGLLSPVVGSAQCKSSSAIRRGSAGGRT
jgi:SAM domain (Sterile alpha motif)